MDPEVAAGTDQSVINSQYYGNSVIFRNAAYAGNERLNRWYVNLLTNFKGTGVEGLYDNKIFSIPVWWDWTK